MPDCRVYNSIIFTLFFIKLYDKNQILLPFRIKLEKNRSRSFSHAPNEYENLCRHHPNRPIHQKPKASQIMQWLPSDVLCGFLSRMRLRNAPSCEQSNRTIHCWCSAMFCGLRSLIKPSTIREQRQPLRKAKDSSATLRRLRHQTFHFTSDFPNFIARRIYMKWLLCVFVGGIFGWRRSIKSIRKLSASELIITWNGIEQTGSLQKRVVNYFSIIEASKFKVLSAACKNPRKVKK